MTNEEIDNPIIMANYGAIEHHHTVQVEGETDVSGARCVFHNKNNGGIGTRNRRKLETIGSSFVMVSAVLLLFFFSSSNRTSHPHSSMDRNQSIFPLFQNFFIWSILAPKKKDNKNSDDNGTSTTTDQVPFPSIDRDTYGANPVPASSIVDPSLFAPSLLGSSSLLKVPFPTAAFFTNLVIQPTGDRQLSFPIMVYPYGYKWNPFMLQVSYPPLRRLMDEVSIRDIFNPDLTLRTVEDVSSRQIQSFDPLSVTVRFQCTATDDNNNQKKEEESFWETYMVQGSPYITAQYEHVTPILQPISIFQGISCLDNNILADSGGGALLCKDFNSQNNNQQGPPPNYIRLQGTHFVLTTRENLMWMVFTSEPVTLAFDNIRKTTVTTEKPFSGILRLALIPPLPKESLEYTNQFPDFYETSTSSTGVRALIQHSNVYPIGAKVQWEFPSPNVGTVQFQFQTKVMTTTSTQSNNSQLLMLALPHHVDVLSSSSKSITLLNDKTDFDLIYRTIKGHLTAVVGSTWSYEEELSSIGFDDPDNALENAAKLDATTRTTILDQMAFDVTRVLPTLDENVYGYGKQVARLAQLVHIANVLLRTSTLDNAADAAENNVLPTLSRKVWTHDGRIYQNAL
jgi:endoglucanase Acf2